MVNFTQQELWNILDSCSDGIYVCDSSFKAIWVNRIFEDITGIPADKWMKLSAFEFLDKNIVGDSVVKRVYEQRKCVTIVQTYKTTNRIALLTGRPIMKDGKTFEIVVTARDVTDIKLLSDELSRLRKENERVHKSLESLKNHTIENKQSNINDGLIYTSEVMHKVLEFCRRISMADSTVLILGETGVGKEVIAKTIHRMSPRAKKPFVAVNCSAIPGELLESELFGYAPGAFTGAQRSGTTGLIEQGNKGTVFLDEIGDMPLALQSKLLHVLQDKKVRKVGGTEQTAVDIRFIAATNKNLQAVMKQGSYREDLYYRLHVITVKIPPLRERREDIAILTNHFLNKFNDLYGFRKYFHFETMKAFSEYSWPGNVRELQNIVESLVITIDNNAIYPTDLPWEFNVENFPPQKSVVRNGTNLKRTLEKIEKEIIIDTLQNYPTAEKAADALGISQPTMVRKMQKYNLKLVMDKKLENELI